MLQLDCDYATYFLRAKGTTTTVTRTFGNTNASTLSIVLPAGYVLPLIAVQCAAGMVGLVNVRKPADGTQEYRYVSSAPPGSPVTYWVFDNPSVLSPSPGGLTLFDDQGRVTFSSDYAPMMALDVLAVGGATGGFYDRPWAPIATSSNRPGKNLAFAQSCYGGLRTKGPLIAYNGGSIVRPQQGVSYTWRFNNNGDVYGATSNGSTVTLGAISYDDVLTTVGSGTSDQIQPIYDAILNFNVRCIGLVVDVTNL